MSEHIQTELADRILTVRLNRPDKKNALTGEMYAALAAAMQRADEDPSINVIFITGTQECFTSGNDISSFLTARASDPDRPVVRFLRGLVDLGKPVVAAVNGPAVGVGVTMLLHCDLVYAARDARFQLPFANIGICLEAGSSVLLPALMGPQRAAELILLGESFGPDKAREYGLVNDIFPVADYQQLAYAKAQRLAAQPPDALRTCRSLLRRTSRSTLHEAMTAEFAEVGRLVQGPEAREAMTAFLQKRKPDFSKLAS
jgi:enoyl-CoA hydratase/carnithine racemase